MAVSLLACMQALGRALLCTLEGGKHSHEGFITCRQLSVSTGFLILTRVHVLVVNLPHLATSHWVPALTWAAALGDLEHCSISSDSQQDMHFLVMQPELSMLHSQQLLPQKAPGLGVRLRLPTRKPWQAYTATLQVSSLLPYWSSI